MKLVALALLLAAAATVDAGLRDASVPYVGCFHSKHFYAVKKDLKSVEECIKECERDKLPLVGMVGVLTAPESSVSPDAVTTACSCLVTRTRASMTNLARCFLGAYMSRCSYLNLSGYHICDILNDRFAFYVQHGGGCGCTATTPRQKLEDKECEANGAEAVAIYYRNAGTSAAVT